MLDALNPHFTYGDYRVWQGDERWELIDGEAWAMSPAPSLRHQEIIGELYRQLANHLLGKPCRVLMAPLDVRLPQSDETDDEIDTVVQPDIVVVCDRRKIDAKGIRGAPDWVIEVLSPATAIRDRVAKRDLFERHGVLEYWLVDPDGVITVFRRQGTGFAPPLAYTSRPVLSTVLPDFELDWALLFPA
jgi:Uma2 family endonuclease